MNAVDFSLDNATRFQWWPGMPVVAEINGELRSFNFTDGGKRLAAIAVEWGWRGKLSHDLWLYPPEPETGYLGDSVEAGMAPSVQGPRATYRSMLPPL
jgi:hypothetical protein